MSVRRILDCKLFTKDVVIGHWGQGSKEILSASGGKGNVDKNVESNSNTPRKWWSNKYSNILVSVPSPKNITENGAEIENRWSGCTRDQSRSHPPFGIFGV